MRESVCPIHNVPWVFDTWCAEIDAIYARNRDIDKKVKMRLRGNKRQPGTPTFKERRAAK